jgi:hypothetical protein
MKKFLESNFTVIVFVLAILGLFKGCGDSREIAKIRKEIEAIKDTTYTKDELAIELKIVGLESEKRMIQATDRRLLDVHRQSEIDAEINKIKSEGK